MRAALAFCRLLVRLHPREFRERHGAALLATVEESLRNGGGFLRACRIVVNLSGGIITERVGMGSGAMGEGRQERVGAAVHELRMAMRTLVRTPAHAAVAVATLAVGLGACVALFSVLNAVVLRPLPFAEPDRLVHLWSRNDAQGTERYVVSQLDFEDWRRDAATFEAMASYWRTQYTMIEGRADPESVRAAMNTWNLFELLGVRPLLGRVFRASDGEPGAAPVAVISESFWKRRFGGDPAVIGRSIMLDGTACEIIGIVADAQAFPNDVQAWTAMNFVLTNGTRTARWLSVIGRVRSGVTVEAARSDLENLAARLAEEHPDNAGWGVTVLDLRSTLLGDARRALILLFGAASLVLLVACANVAGMTLLRAQERVRETAVRASLGATRLRIAVQLLMESLLLSIGGAAAGLGLAALLLRALPGLSLGGLPRIEDVRFDGASALVTTGCILFTALVLGLAPVFQSRRVSLSGVLTEGLRGTTSGRARARMRSLFVVAQVATAVVLVTGAVQLARSFGRLLEVDPGFVPRDVVTMHLILGPEIPDFGAAARFYTELEDRVRALPGVVAAGLATTLPLGERYDYTKPVLLPDAPVPPEHEVRPWVRQVTPGFFDALHVPLLRGRTFTADDRVDSAPVVIINESFARRFFGETDPIGRHISDTAMRAGPLGVILNDEVEIVGVVGNVRYAALREDPEPAVYFPVTQAPFRRMIMTVRTQRTPADLAGAVRGIVAELHPRLPVSDVMPLQSRVDRELAPERRNLVLIGGFGAIALMLSGLGVFGVVSWSARQRVPEFGVRLAVGAQPVAILALVLRQALVLVVVGIAVGLLVTLPALRILASLLYGVSARDPLSLAAVALILAATGLAAGLIPALRATRMDPLRALRN